MNSRLTQTGGTGIAASYARLFKLGCAATIVLALAHVAAAQTAYISDAWWTFQQDCDGDLAFAGTLFGNVGRLNWPPAVTNCNGTLTVFEVISQRACGSSLWAPIYTNAPHPIAGCQSIAHRYLDVPFASGGACREYRIQIYRNGQANPDYVRSSTNDIDLAQHKEELLSEDVCASDFFTSCVSLSGPARSQAGNSHFATEGTGET